MIDIDQFLSELNREINKFADPNQLLKADQKAQNQTLQLPRITDKIIIFGNEESPHAMIREKELVESDSEDFEYDIERKYFQHPEATISFTGIGEGALSTLIEIRNWFRISDLHNPFLDNQNCFTNVPPVGEIDDRTTFLESNYQKKWGFDAFIKFEEVITVTVETIETAVIEINGQEITIED